MEFKEVSGLVLKVLAFFFIIAGGAMVFGARQFVDRFGLDRNIKCDYENEMDEEEIKQYKTDKAVLNFKMLGMLAVLPGIVLILIAFK